MDKRARTNFQLRSKLTRKLKSTDEYIFQSIHASQNEENNKLMSLINKKLKPGQIVKNYKELCSLLNLPVCGGAQKVFQLKRLNGFFSYDRDGHKYIIKEIYPLPTIVQDARVCDVTRFFAMLLLYGISHPNVNHYFKDAYFKSNNDQDVLSIHKYDLFRAMGMCSLNFSSQLSKKHIDMFFVEKCPDLTPNLVQSFYLSASSRLTQDAIRALDYMKRHDILDYTIVKEISQLIPKDEQLYKKKLEQSLPISLKDYQGIARIATPEEEKIIKETKEYVIKKKYNSSSEFNIMASGKYNELVKTLNSVLLDRYKFKFICNKYLITIKDKNAYKEIQKLDKSFFNSHKQMLNDAICKSLTIPTMKALTKYYRFANNGYGYNVLQSARFFKDQTPNESDQDLSLTYNNDNEYDEFLKAIKAMMPTKESDEVLIEDVALEESIESVEEIDELESDELPNTLNTSIGEDLEQDIPMITKFLLDHTIRIYPLPSED